MKNWRQYLANGYIRCARGLKGVEKKVVFTSFSGKTYSDNPRAISEALHLLMPDVRIVWLLNDPKQKEKIVPQYVERVNNSFLQHYFQIATAKVYVTNNSFPWFPKNKKQLVIQTWHGDKAFKKVLFDVAFSTKKLHHVAEAIPGFCDYAVAGSVYGERQYRSAFRYTGNVLMEGTPRNDKLIAADERLIADVKERLSIAEDVKLMLYAPTLRRAAGRGEQQIQDIDIPALISLLEKRDNCKWVCLLRAHPVISGLVGAANDSRIINVSGFEDMADLLLVADLLITDYSSCAGDFALCGRPVVLYQPDRKEYLEKDRTFYFDIEESPYFVAENQGTLEAILQNMTDEKARENCREILDFYGDVETGKASERVAQIIKNWIEEQWGER